MNYTSRYLQLQAIFNNSGEEISLPGSDRKCIWLPFTSKVENRIVKHSLSLPGLSHDAGLLSDNQIKENNFFSYPVFKGRLEPSKDKPILLLHGLNERSWTKYLVWADYLSEHTGRSVILFPIAYHMNRSPLQWADPRSMTSLLEERKREFGMVPKASFANVALSDRLTREPVRFLTSGYQSALDIIQLTKQLKSGTHPLFQGSVGVDVFAYSIGAFLAQIMFLANPDQLLDDSRLFLFCGGAYFESMQGASRLIMDQHAFEVLYRFYLDELPREALKNESIAETLHRTELGRAFLAMLSGDYFKSFREDRWKKLHEQISVVALEKDEVIPSVSIKKALITNNVEVLGFEYPYSHETPFPILKTNASAMVDKGFDKIFRKASMFLA